MINARGLWRWTFLKFPAAYWLYSFFFFLNTHKSGFKALSLSWALLSTCSYNILYWFDMLAVVNVYFIDRCSVRLKLSNILHQCYIHHHCDIIQSSLILWIQKPVRHRLRPPSLSQNALHLEFLHITNRCWLIMYRFPSTIFWWSVVYSLQTPQITLAEHKEDSLCFHYYLM